MKKKQNQKVWVYAPHVPTFTVQEKEKILITLKATIERLPKLSKKVSRVQMRANRIYLYELAEQFGTEGAVFIQPLIDGKYLEFPYARITLNDKRGDSSTADWQRHNNQWITLFTGTFTECIHSIEDDNTWH
jgi:hypothetical protein